MLVWNLARLNWTERHRTELGGRSGEQNRRPRIKQPRQEAPKRIRQKVGADLSSLNLD